MLDEQVIYGDVIAGIPEPLRAMAITLIPHFDAINVPPAADILAAVDNYSHLDMREDKPHHYLIQCCHYRRMNRRIEVNAATVEYWRVVPCRNGSNVEAFRATPLFKNYIIDRRSPKDVAIAILARLSERFDGPAW